MLYPSCNDAPFLILVWGLLAFPEFIVQLAKGNYFYSVLYLFLYFGVAYISTIIVDMTKFFRRILRPAFFFILSLFTVMDVYCLYTYRTRLTYNFIEIIGGTNPDEAKEYFAMYVEWYKYILLVLVFSGCWFLYWISGRLKNNFILNPYFSSILFCCGLVSIFINPTLQDEFVTWNFNFEDVADLRKYPANPQLSQTIDSLPQYVVMVIGESHAKSHSSLYGYEKDTNPLLRKLRDKGNLITFDQVESPATNTSNSFKYILNTYQKDKDNQDKWYKSVNLIEVLNKTGYNTLWLSNQARQGLYNNLSSAPAMLCDSAIFIREFSNDQKYDSELAEISIPEERQKTAVIYHLMGQHILFNERYPEEFEKFKKEAYSLSPNNEIKENVARYDNACLYNDFTLNSIIEKYADKDAIIFYFPDHGLDVYESSPDYCGHALPNPESESVGVKIPFMVYLSDIYKGNRQELAKRIEDAAGKPFCTDKFIYAMMDAVGLSFSDSDDVKKYSPFSSY